MPVATKRTVGQNEGSLNFVIQHFDDENYEGRGDEDTKFLEDFLDCEGVRQAVQMLDVMEGMRINPAEKDTVSLVKTVLDDLKNDDSADAEEMEDILHDPNIRALFMSYDDVSNKTYDDTLPPGAVLPKPGVQGGTLKGANSDSRTATMKSIPTGMNPALLQGSVRMVGIRKSPEESLGMTVKVEKGELVVARIIADSVIDKQKLLNVGDLIKEVNGREVATPSELKEAVEHCNDNIIVKIVPGYMQTGYVGRTYFRALFAFDPSKDQLIPCRQAGIQFQDQDILEILNQDDRNWWQARKIELDEHGEEVVGPTGLIPSQVLMERRKAFVRPEWDYTKSSLACGMVKKKKRKVFYSSNQASEFDKCEFAIYEEVCKMPPFERKTLVLVGAQGVGRRTLKNQLLSYEPGLFGTTMPHTSRRKGPGDEEGRGYYFVDREQMENDISNGQYLEFGEYRDEIYGTKLDSVRQVIQSAKMCILDVNPQALKMLKTAEFRPFVVFVASPSTEILEAMHNQARYLGLTLADKTEEDFERTVRESVEIEKTYKQYFDVILVNDNMDMCFQILYDTIQGLSSDSQWVPVSWVY